jgi:hypothetical protein
MYDFYSDSYIHLPQATYTTPHQLKAEPDLAERRILAAMVERAALDADPGDNTPGATREQLAAFEWLLDPGEEEFSFRWICRVFGVNPGLAQAALRERFEKTIARLERVN